MLLQASSSVNYVPLKNEEMKRVNYATAAEVLTHPSFNSPPLAMEIAITLRISKSAGPNSLAREKGLFVSIRLTIKYILENLQLLSGIYSNVIPLLQK